MTRKAKTLPPQKAALKSKRSFSTVHEALSHFFPETRPRDGYAKGEERGTEAAERVFADIAQSLHS
jgi:hypothetical protein